MDILSNTTKSGRDCMWIAVEMNSSESRLWGWISRNNLWTRVNLGDCSTLSIMLHNLCAFPIKCVRNAHHGTIIIRRPLHKSRWKWCVCRIWQNQVNCCLLTTYVISATYCLLSSHPSVSAGNFLMSFSAQQHYVTFVPMAISVTR